MVSIQRLPVQRDDGSGAAGGRGRSRLEGFGPQPFQGGRVNAIQGPVTITLLEEQKVELIPVQNIGFTYNKKDSVKDFLKWIITDGQKYNHEYGFLNIDEKTQGYQKKQLESKLLTTN
jgi:hypothetical protein